MKPTIQHYAHLFVASKRSGFKWELKITDKPALSESIAIAVYRGNSKTELKKQAKALNATPWNY